MKLTSETIKALKLIKQFPNKTWYKSLSILYFDPLTKNSEKSQSAYGIIYDLLIKDNLIKMTRQKRRWGPSRLVSNAYIVELTFKSECILAALKGGKHDR